MWTTHIAVMFEQLHCFLLLLASILIVVSVRAGADINAQFVFAQTRLLMMMTKFSTDGMPGQQGRAVQPQSQPV